MASLRNGTKECRVTRQIPPSCIGRRRVKAVHLYDRNLRSPARPILQVERNARKFCCSLNFNSVATFSFFDSPNVCITLSQVFHAAQGTSNSYPLFCPVHHGPAPMCCCVFRGARDSDAIGSSC